MSRVSEILVRVRDSLADADKSRWSDSRLVRLIDEAQKDMVQKAQMLRSKVDISIVGDKAEYELPSDSYLLTRVVDEFGGKIDLRSHNEMDEVGALSGENTVYNRSYYSTSNSTDQVRKRWESEVGAPIQYIIFDKQDPRHFKVYPIPVDSDSAGDTFTLLDYGVATLVEGDLMASDFGVVSDITSSASDTTSFNSVYGVLVDMASVIASLTCYYRRLPLDITSINDTPEIEPIWDKGMRYYAISLALADDQDTQNLAVADKYMAMYLRELKEAETTTSRNNISSSPRKATYNRVV